MEFFLACGSRRDRTADLYNAIVALSQLSYEPSFITILERTDPFKPPSFFLGYLSIFFLVFP